MGKGSYRGGSTLIGWGANRFVAPDNRQSRKAVAEDTAKSPDEATEANELARANFGFRRKKRLKAEPAPLSPEQEAASATAGQIEKLRKVLAKKRKENPQPLKIAGEQKRPRPSSAPQIAKLERLARRRAKEGDPLEGVVVQKRRGRRSTP